MREVNGAVPFYPAKPKERQTNSKYWGRYDVEKKC